MTEIQFDFGIQGDPWDNPAELTDVLGINPTDVRRKGELISGRTQRRSSFSMWTYYSPTKANDFGDAIKSFLDMFEEKAYLIGEYAMKHPTFYINLCFVVCAHPDKFPDICFDQRLITFAQQAHTIISFDTYIDEIYG
jgi:hypothetical protein